MRIPSRSLVLVPCLALCLAVALAAPGCGSDGAAREGPDVYHVTQERNGDTIGLAVGQELAVVLPSLAGSSSRWGPEEVDASVLQQSSGSRTVGGTHGGMIIGGSKAYESITFRAVRPGATRLRMARARTDREGGGVARFQIDVVVGSGTNLR